MAAPEAKLSGSQSSPRDHTFKRDPLPEPRASTSSSRSGAHRVRVSHACDRCRLMRTKCTGGLSCSRCTKDKVTCAYGDRKRECNKKDFAGSLQHNASLQVQVGDLLGALRKVVSSPQFDRTEHEDVVEFLSKYSAKQDPEKQEDSAGQSWSQGVEDKMDHQFRDGDQPQGIPGEQTASSEVGSPRGRDELSNIVDLGNGSGAVGYIGKMSEMSWIQRAQEYLQPQLSQTEGDESDGDGMQRTIESDPIAATKFAYFMDETDFMAIDEDLVDEQTWPPLGVALMLSEAYFHSLQGAFHFVPQEAFLESLLTFPKDKAMLSWTERRWLAMANLVWAVGTKWLEITNLARPEFTEDHVVYYARARALGLDHRILIDHPDVERVQAIGLLAFYLLINGSVTRAWNILGQATRHAVALALHLKVADPTISETERERRANIWYSLYNLEVFLAEITGRPTSIFHWGATVAVGIPEVPRTPWSHGSEPIDGDNSNNAMHDLWLDYFHSQSNDFAGPTDAMEWWETPTAVNQSMWAVSFPHRVRLCQLSGDIATKLYTAAEDDTWADIQRKMEQLQTELQDWTESLPSSLVINSTVSPGVDDAPKVELALYFHSVRMMLFRPCLCEIVIENESRMSEDFNFTCARSCVQAAMSLLSILPDDLLAYKAYRVLPWWSLLHYVTQATAVLVLELCLEAQHFVEDVPELISHLHIAMTYIWRLAETSMSASQAWKIFKSLLVSVAHKYEHLRVSDLLDGLSWPKED